MDFEKEPLTWADLVLLFPVILTEVVAAVSPDSKLADDRLEDIGGRLLDIARDTTNPRAGALISALAKQLIATEEGA